MSASKSPASNPSITPDPSVDGSPIRKAFLIEATANLASIPMITNTSFVLSLILKNPSDINPSTILFTRLFGGIVVGGLTSGLLAGYSNTRNGIESRRIVYMMLGLGEALMIPVLVNEMFKDGREAAISKKVAGSVISMLLPPLLWRLYVLFIRPDLLGRYTESDGEGKSKRAWHAEEMYKIQRRSGNDDSNKGYDGG